MNNKIITIGRQYGSGGRAIGKALAEKLGIECYDSRLIEYASENGKVDLDRLAGVDEKRANPWLYTNYNEFATEQTGYALPMNDMLFGLQADIIRHLAGRESCIIIGRCADYILRKNPNAYSVFIRADWDDRVKQISDRRKVTEKQAVSLIKRTDKERSCYYNFFTDKRWGRSESYDIVLNRSSLGIDGCINALRLLVEENC